MLRMTRRSLYIALALGGLSAVPAVLLVRRAASAQRPGPHVVAPHATGGGPATPRDASRAGAPAPATPPPPIVAAVDGFDPSQARRENGRYVVDLPGGRRAALTVEPNWQRAVTQLLDRHELPRAAVVVLDTDTGRVRAYVSRAEAGAPDLARDATPPAASVFKMVTSSALIAHGLNENTVTCFSGGFHALTARDLVPDAHRDRDCISLADAFGRSANTVFARRAQELLNPAELLQTAHSWGFGEAVPFDALVSPGDVDVSSEPLEFARTAAGFWHSHLSPVHGAVMAQAVARGGELQRPYIIETLYGPDGVVVGVGAPHAWRRAVSPEVATTLAHMMVHSVTIGTARQAFHDDAGHPFLPGVDVGGKTGTLTGANPYRAYTWFVGNAASSNLRVSFAVMVANGPTWRVKAATVARQVLQIVYRGHSTD
jgi:cell division protein FtsI/penicillin-binding protein 2